MTVPAYEEAPKVRHNESTSYLKLNANEAAVSAAIAIGTAVLGAGAKIFSGYKKKQAAQDRAGDLEDQREDRAYLLQQYQEAKQDISTLLSNKGGGVPDVLVALLIGLFLASSGYYLYKKLS